MLVETLAVVHVAITAAYCSVLWVVQFVVYPQFLRVPEEVFADYHREHCRRIGWIVAPLFVAEGVGAVLLAWLLGGAQPVLQTLSLLLFAIGHGLTFVVFVPLHRRLGQEGGAPAILHRAVRLNGWRVAVATARLVVVGAICAGVLT